jgi:hemolysin III
MNDLKLAGSRSQSLGEEIANSVSHGIGLVAAVIAAPFLLVGAAARHGSTGTVAAASVFAATTVLLYLTSTMYHALAKGRAMQVFRKLDHAAIFLMIAGTYTPFALGVLRGEIGWTLFGIVWGLAIFGIVLKIVGRFSFPKLSTGVYLAMGWLVLIAAQPLSVRMPKAGLLWLFWGGIAYTVGVTFYAAKRLRYSHFVWHLFVLAGTVCHFFAVLWYAF